MKMESIPSVKNAGEEKRIALEKSRINSLVSRIREKYPNFERVIKTPLMLARLLAVVTIMGGGGELLAQDISNKGLETKSRFTIENIDELDTLSVPEIEAHLDPLKLSPPEGQLRFSKARRSNNINFEETKKGAIPTDTGMVGDVGIYNTGRFIEKNKDVRGSKEGESNREILLATETKVLDNFTNKKIEKSVEDTIKATGHGLTKEDAIMAALEELNNIVGLYVSSGSLLISEEMLRSRKAGTSSVRFTEYTATEAFNLFRALHIDKIEEIEEGDSVAYLAHVSAQKGQLIEK
jgi:hypothetical protein